MSRPSILVFFCFVLLFSCQQREQIPLEDDGTSTLFRENLRPFYHGVASGDPLPNAVIIWTRVTPSAVQEVEVSWEVALDQDFKQVVQSGKTNTDESKDYTVKVDVTGLQPNTVYHYHFKAFGNKSMTGRTKTLPTNDPGQVQLAIVSCSNYEAGYFNALGRIAERSDLDAVLHLGDYIYEYGVGGYGDTALSRKNLPTQEIVSISDYRTRYALYRLDPDFQKAHQRHPFITIWDDHEITNNSYVDGAQNHQPEEEGDYNVRKSVARQAYYEWLPIREKKELYRKFEYGNLVDLLMLDERLAGRQMQADSINTPAYRDSTRTMLGDVQVDWFLQNLKESEAVWKVVGNQVIFSDLSFEKIFPNRPKNMDAWDGYPFEKKKIIDFLKDGGIQNTIWVTGDTHCSWAFETPTSIEGYLADSVAAVVAVEFGTTSISSSNYDERTSMDTVKMVEGLYLQDNPHLKYVDLSQHGYLLLTLTPEAATAEWWYVDTIKEPSSAESLAQRLQVMKDGKTLSSGL
ncbi:MAG: alkaline phosphatase D family protein [Bacteroidota bacterium]